MRKRERAMSISAACTVVRDVVLQIATISDFKRARELLLTVKDDVSPLLKEQFEKTLSLVSSFESQEHKVVRDNIIELPPDQESVTRAVLDLLVEVTKINSCGFLGVKIDPATSNVYERLYEAVLCLMTEPIHRVALLAAAKILVRIRSELPAIGGWRDKLKYLLLDLVQEDEEPSPDLFDKKSYLILSQPQAEAACRGIVELFCNVASIHFLRVT